MVLGPQPEYRLAALGTLAVLVLPWELQPLAASVVPQLVVVPNEAVPQLLLAAVVHAPDELAWRLVTGNESVPRAAHELDALAARSQPRSD